MAQPDYGTAHAELTSSPWIAHLAAGLAAAMGALALGGVIVSGQVYVRPMAEEGVMLPKLAQMLWQASAWLAGLGGFVVSLVLILLCFFLWRRAAAGHGGATKLLFALAAAGLLVSIVAVLGAATPVRSAQDQMQDGDAPSGR
ncbi:MAG: hypothetical protein IPK67_12325 [Planctomycetes bacterium]|nr:hypothetical protein [Planctomycetota bacterium]